MRLEAIQGAAAVDIGQQRFQRGQRGERISQSREIAWACAVKSDAGEYAFHVPHVAQRIPQAHIVGINRE